MSLLEKLRCWRSYSPWKLKGTVRGTEPGLEGNESTPTTFTPPSALMTLITSMAPIAFTPIYGR